MSNPPDNFPVPRNEKNSHSQAQHKNTWLSHLLQHHKYYTKTI